ncbi:MAG: sigma-70 family RNA polymerase sigma factor [Patescibacteria group bacterium]
MEESTSYFDNIEFEEERQRLWRLYHQYPRPSDHNYRITLIRKIAVLHGGYAKLPKLSEQQKTILEMYYEWNVSNASIGMRIGVREKIIHQEHDVALQLLEHYNNASVPENRIIPIRAPRVSSLRQSPVGYTSFAMPTSINDFWERYDSETNWRRKREMMRAYLAAFPPEDTFFIEREHMAVQELVVEGKDVSSVMHAEGVSRQTIHNHFNGALDKLRIRDGVAPLHQKKGAEKKRKASLIPSVRKPIRKKSELRGEEMLVAYLADPMNKKLRDQLVLEWVPLIHFVIKRKVYVNLAHFEYDDYVSMGMAGLLKAVDSYDPARGTFKTHAINQITYAIQNGTKSELGVHNAYVRAMAIANEVKEIEKQEEVGALDTKMSERKSKLQRQLESIMLVIKVDSLDRPLGDKHDGIQLSLDRRITYAEAVREDSATEMYLDRLAEYICILSQREQDVLYYTLYEGVTPTMIGRKYGITKKVVECMIDDAVEKLRRAFFQSDESHDDIRKASIAGYDPDSEVFQSAFALLSYKQREALRLREEEGFTLEVAGKRLGVTRERIRQLEASARQQLKEFMKKS